MSDEYQSIEGLSESILHNTLKITDYLRSHSLPSPSFDVNAPRTSMIPPEATEIQEARAQVINDTLRLRDLMLGPQDYLQSFTVPPFCGTITWRGHCCLR